MADSKQLYQEVILDHNRKPRNWGLPPEATHQAEGVNPLCGDHIHVALKLAGDLLEAVGFEGESCAICKASASMMTSAVKGKPRAEAEQQEEEDLVHVACRVSRDGAGRSTGPVGGEPRERAPQPGSGPIQPEARLNTNLPS